jgi:hypothetical protein
MDSVLESTRTESDVIGADVGAGGSGRTDECGATARSGEHPESVENIQARRIDISWSRFQ